MDSITSQDQNLIDGIKARIQDPKRLTTMSDKWGYSAQFYPPVTLAVVEAAEQQIGFHLPSLIREIYLQVGNGGFGPGYGIIGLEGGYEVYEETLAESYLGFQTWEQMFLSERLYEDYLEWEWEKSYLAYGYWGCNVTTVVDCADPNLSIYSLDSTLLKPHSLGNLRQWWLDWLEGGIHQY